MLLVSEALACLGQGLTALSGKQHSYGMMLTSRSIYGAGGELIFMLQALYTSLWFSDDKLELALSICAMVPFTFKILAGVIYPRVTMNAEDSTSRGIEEASLIGFYFCITSCFFAIMLIAVERSIPVDDDPSGMHRRDLLQSDSDSVGIIERSDDEEEI